MKKINLVKIASAVVLATSGMAAQAAGPDWSLILSGPGFNLLPPPPAQVAPVRAAPVVVAPPVVMPPPVQPGVIRDNRDYRNDGGWERDRDRQFQERENYWLEREGGFIAREKAFLEREKQRQLVLENNQRASVAINNRQDQQLDQIVEGVNLGRIDRNEFVDLMGLLKNIRERERAFMTDGFMSQDEFNALTTDLNDSEQKIRFFSRPDRPSRDRIYYPQVR